MSLATPKTRQPFAFRLDLHSGVPAYRQIIDQVTGGIAAGSLSGGDQLPTVRQVAVDLSINPNTVMRAYRELEIRGVLESMQGTGTFISHQDAKPDDADRQRRLGQLAGEFAARAGAAGFTLQELVDQLKELNGSHRKDKKMRTKGMNDVDLGVNRVGIAAFVICIFAGLAITASVQKPYPVIIFILIGLYLLFAIRVADQWEKVALLRSGRYVGLRGPGIFFIVPIIDSLSRFVDQRVRVSSVTAESTLTRDTVPVNVDAIVFWLVWNAEKSILEVSDFEDAINMSAQTGLRESIGRHELAQMITERETMGRELQRILDEKTNPWGITVQSVEIRDVRIPQALEDAMSRQAQAERERQARNILGQAETEISERFAQAAKVYEDNPVALHLRAMNMLYEAIKERGAMVIVPSSVVETMGLGGMLATASLNGAKIGEQR